ncbi:MAG: RNA 2',3'-cyclic phosphodiesterase [Methanobacteriaceae archaeon]|nr:RNA 2',3'-cyclic phosphodiesterase [Methanobacteriaceae archaeon]
MSGIRSFLAIEIEPDLKPLINNLIKEFKNTDANIKYVTADNMHLTLKFFGDVSEDKLNKIEKATNNVLKDFSQFNLRVEGMGTFPNSDHIKVIWVGIDNNSELELLEKKLDNEFNKLGFKKERNYTSHLTIGRMKNAKNKQKVQKIIQENNEVFIGEMTVDKLHLKKSTLTSNGPIYEDLKVFPLKKE